MSTSVGSSRPSRFRRPSTPSGGLILTERDRALLEAVHRHRVVRAEHLHALFFSGRSARACQLRLRRLWEHRYLERLYLPVVLRGELVPRRATQPVYVLAWRGFDAIASGPSSAESAIAELARPKPLALRTLEHHLVVTDWIVSILVTPSPEGVQVLIVEHDHRLARLAHAAREELPRGRGALVPDGAVTWLTVDGRPATVYLEVVRAEVRGGNRRLIDKLRRIAEANRDGLFERLYGHKRLRAVLIATPTARRAETLRALARELPHARSLFWFGAFEEASELGPFATRFQPGSVLDLEWRTAEGELHTQRELVAPEPPRQGDGARSQTSG